MFPALRRHPVGRPIGFRPLVALRNRRSPGAGNRRHRARVDQPCHAAAAIDRVDDVPRPRHPPIVDILRNISAAKRLRLPIRRVPKHRSNVEDGGTPLERGIVGARREQIAPIDDGHVRQALQILHAVLAPPRTRIADAGAHVVPVQNEFAHHVAAGEPGAAGNGDGAVLGRDCRHLEVPLGVLISGAHWSPHRSIGSRRYGR